MMEVRFQLLHRLRVIEGLNDDSCLRALWHSARTRVPLLSRDSSSRSWNQSLSMDKQVVSEPPTMVPAHLDALTSILVTPGQWSLVVICTSQTAHTDSD